MILALISEKTHGALVILRARRTLVFAEVSMNYAVRLMHTLRWVGIAGVISAAHQRAGPNRNPAAREALVLCQRRWGFSRRRKYWPAASSAPRSRAGGTARRQRTSPSSCNLGKRLQIDQHTLWLLAGLNGSIVPAETRHCSELAPDIRRPWPPRQMLAELPQFLGGDAQEGRLLRRAVGLAPAILNTGRAG
jgi:hypothetical protein